MKNNKTIIKSDVEFKVKEEVEEVLTTEIKKVVDEMSAKYMRNVKVTISTDIE